MPDAERPWLALDFDDPVLRWVHKDGPSLAAIRVVRDWIRSREVNPFDGVRLVPGFTDMLFAVIPGTLDSDGRIVTCTYVVHRDDKVIRCCMLETERWPV